MRKRVGIVQTNVRDLYEILFFRHDVAHEKGGALFHEVHVELPVHLRLAEGFCYTVDGLYACALFDDVWRRRQLEIGGKRGDVQLRDAELTKPIDVTIRQRRAAHEKRGAFFVEDALCRHHADFELV